MTWYKILRTIIYSISLKITSWIWVRVVQYEFCEQPDKICVLKFENQNAPQTVTIENHLNYRDIKFPLRKLEFEWMVGFLEKISLSICKEMSCVLLLDLIWSYFTPYDRMTWSIIYKSICSFQWTKEVEIRYPIKSGNFIPHWV